MVPDIADFPLVWTDAHQWAEAAATNKQWLRDQSNVGRLAALLTDLAVQNEAALHMRRRLQPLFDFARSLLGQTADDPDLVALLSETDQARQVAAFESRLAICVTCRTRLQAR
ncbi:hypothetical protein [Georgenia sp. SUBG003]|uniref:hypothetical protein n=1 Tax=Georgenia sp. SUBG003 TaxID=1497974 RepID=UPI003AB4D5CD